MSHDHCGAASELLPGGAGAGDLGDLVPAGQVQRPAAAAACGGEVSTRGDRGDVFFLLND